MRIVTKYFMNLVCALGALAVTSSCSSLECGEGTVEMDGVCETMLELPEGGPAFCSEETKWNPVNGRCELIANGGVCGDNTALDVIDGTPVCVGTGGGNNVCTGCAPCNCPPAKEGMVNLCGRIYNAGDTAPVGTVETPLAGNPLKIVAYEPLLFIGSTPGNRPEPVGFGTINECGYYSILDIQAQESGLLALGVDDADDSGADEYVLTGSALTAPGGFRDANRRAWVVKNTTDAAWSSSAALEGGTFGSKGAWLGIFADTSQPAVPPFDGAPKAGVTITGNSPRGYFFDDTDPLVRSNVAPAMGTTGPNGSGLVLGFPALTAFGGQGSGCDFPQVPAATPPGVIVVHLFEAACQ